MPLFEERCLSESCLREKDSFHPGISLKKGASIVHYGFRIMISNHEPADEIRSVRKFYHLVHL